MGGQRKSMPERAGQTMGKLGADLSGVSFLEFALILPVLLTLGLFGAEVAYMSIVDMQVSMIATSVADNASRLGQTDNSSVTPTVTEREIASVMTGALTEGGSIDLTGHGRVILSSLEYDADRDRQYISWQRCVGSFDRASDYGGEGYGRSGPRLQNMGENGHAVTASSGTAVMFVEVFYEYQPLFGAMYSSGTTFHHEAAYIIRDDRNLEPGVTGGNSTTSCD